MVRLRGKEIDSVRGVVEDWERPEIMVRKKEMERWELWLGWDLRI